MQIYFISMSELLVYFVLGWGLASRMKGLAYIRPRNKCYVHTVQGLYWLSTWSLVPEILYPREEQIGGPDKTVQIDESKFGKRKYHRGHRVEGQWVFSGIEEGSRRSFMVAVDKRDEATLLPLIKKHIAKETTIVSDCWKTYSKLELNGYEHRLVNHSQEFVNEDGFHWGSLKTGKKQTTMFWCAKAGILPSRISLVIWK